MKKYIDLHAHTYYSDGGLSPAAVVEKAKKIGLSAVGIADHDSVSGLSEATSAGKKIGIEVVPATEITCYPSEKREFHILGYFIDWKNKTFQSFLKELQTQREQQAEKVVASLNELGYLINLGDLKSLTRGVIGKPHIAWMVINDLENKKKLLEDFGGIPTASDFIRKYLITGMPAHHRREALDPKDSIDLIHKHGGLAILAHPSWDLVSKDSESGKLTFDDHYLAELLGNGLDGIEVYSHRDSEEDTKLCVAHYEKIAKEKGLAVSGGSDYHGFSSTGKELGFVGFYLKIPYQVLDDLKLRSKK
ncbi:MAG: hypothetical protein A2172_02255 [Candidatus Woykebacteria bacterium RBG_13_40_15]|uniref:Polymerase/histidinol phosphatase N-terminal domain-containing protein n=1 Tax=Candidatus Woykebacteria bacterium RBG_13_40_15 TaxID=1802593 RepID=A0A1G1W691_9BACT|nr:MAG: hypothetical protein A2172_02255 [Candidatus Woykebacteria bacterium RBG_13_40_15]